MGGNTINDIRYAGIDSNKMNFFDPNYSPKTIDSMLIFKGFENSDEILTESHLEREIGKDEKLDIIQKGDVEHDLSAGFMSVESYKKLGEDIDNEIEKGESGNLSIEEFDQLNAINDQYKLLKKSIVDFGNDVMRVAYVLPIKGAVAEVTE